VRRIPAVDLIAATVEGADDHMVLNVIVVLDLDDLWVRYYFHVLRSHFRFHSHLNEMVHF
jgi:hypothetical protein